MAGQVEMVFFDVKHGNSTYIKAPNGKHIVVDLGTGSLRNKVETFSPLLHLQSKYNVQQLDYIVITHPHKDHIADIMNFTELVPKVLGIPYKFTREEIINDKVGNTDIPYYERYMAITEYYNLQIKNDDPRNPDNLANFGGLKINSCCLSRNGSALNINNDSAITVFEYATIKAVITGDNETSSLKRLITDPSVAELVENADILLAPYHGREAGICKEFVELVNPRLTVISDSRYREETSKREWYANKSRGCKVYFDDGKCTYDGQALSTSNDGIIFVKFGCDESNKPFLHISTR